MKNLVNAYKKIFLILSYTIAIGLVLSGFTMPYCHAVLIDGAEAASTGAVNKRHDLTAVGL